MLTLTAVQVGDGDTADEHRWRAAPGSTRVQHELALPPTTARVHADWMSSMLLCLDLTDAHERLLAGELRCSHSDCGGELGPWGTAAPRRVRLDPATVVAHRPRRARCRTCRTTHVLASTRTLPHQVDTAATVGSALLAASHGLGHRRVADQLGLPETTVRGWLRRARANALEIWSTATRWTLKVDPMADPFTPAGHPLVAPVGAVGQAIATYARRFGPVPDPWGVAVLLTRGRLLAPPPRPVFPRPPDSS